MDNVKQLGESKFLSVKELQKADEQMTVYRFATVTDKVLREYRSLWKLGQIKTEHFEYLIKQLDFYLIQFNSKAQKYVQSKKI